MTGTTQFGKAATPAEEPQQPPTAVRERTFTWDDPLETASAGAGLSGLEFFAAMADGSIPAPPIMHTLDFSGMSFDEGRVAFRLTPKEFHYNPLGSVHGGWFATLLDSALGCAVQTTLPAGRSYTTVELSLNIVRPASHKTGPLRAVGTVIRAGRQIATAEARVEDEQGKLYAHATTTCFVFDVPASSAS
jgi:uncharacterized protein (TIGR00369 family)